MSLLRANVGLKQGGFSLEARFEAPVDGITVLFGPSGSGKSTLLAVLAGLRRADRQAVMLDGRDLSSLSPHRRGIGLVFQDARLFPHLSVRRNIEYAARRAPRGGPAIEEMARFFDIAGLLDRRVRNLSGGEKSRVALARALASRPDFLLLDEPFAALDSARRRAFIQVLIHMHRAWRLPMLVVTHNIDDAAALGSHLVALKEGRVVAAGEFSEASRDPQFQALLDSHDSGAAVRLAHSHHGGHWLRADQVLIATEEPKAISARNILPATVQRLTPEPDGVLVELATEAGVILARLTPEAVTELGLAPQKRAWALVKAHAL
ncbi:MAG TPA: ATP-binding cassette domain-containing protein [Rhizomicrobium sp.]|jgi:molybdate transport system ATP-binding protein